MKHNTSKLIINICIALFFIICVIAPIVSMLCRITPSGFASMVSSPQFLSAVINSVSTALVATIISLILAILAAWCIRRTDIKLKSLFGMIFVIPMLIPSISHAFGLVALFGANGLLTNLLHLNGSIYGFWGIVTGSVLYSFPVAFLMYSSILEYEDGMTYKAADVLGIPARSRFIDITLPYLKKTMISAFFAVFTMIVTDYGVPLIDMFDYVYEQKEAGVITLDDDMTEMLDELNGKLTDAKLQLKTDEYSRLLIKTNLPMEGDETFAKLKEFHEIMYKYYPEDNSFIVGDSTSDLDLSTSFVDDNLMISILSALFVLVILVFTFKSAGLPVLLMAIIEGAIWINFSVPAVENTNIFFLSYLIVSSIQMGANIDYAIVISSRYSELKREMSPKEAIVETLNQAFPTIITSGMILSVAGLLIGFMSSDVAISAVGECLGRGTLISIVLVMCVLPQILLLGDAIIEKTSFTLKKIDRIHHTSGLIHVNGRVRGYVSGIVDAKISGIIHGEVSAQLDSEDAEDLRERIDKSISEFSEDDESILTEDD